MRKIVIVGAGALGSHLALFCRNLEASVSLVDFDRVEAKNLQSQFHTKLGSGKNKAKAIQAALQGMFGKKIAANPVKLTADNAEALLGPADLVVDCTDNFAAREVIQGYCRGRTACLHGCLSADGDLARVVWTEHFAADREGQEGQATCEDGRNLPFHALAGALIAQVVQRFWEEGAKQSWQLTPSSMLRLT